MKMKGLICLLLFSAGFCACRKEEIAAYSKEDAGIYFQRTASYVYGGTSVTYANDLKFSFAGQSAKLTKAVYGAEVRTMGNVAGYDRPFLVEIDREQTTGIEGVHYEARLDTFKIAAGENGAKVQLTFFRTPDLLDSTVTVVLHLLENEHFKNTIGDYKNSNQWNVAGDSLDGTRFTFKYNEQYTEPYYWWAAEDFLGPWTPQKYIVVNDVMGWTVSDWNNAGFSGAKISYGRMSFAAKAVQNYLQEQADLGMPVKDKDGSYMQLADGYGVDYSRYE